MSERLQRLVMSAFRGVPGEMTVDFGQGHSIVIYGENGTGIPDTIGDATRTALQASEVPSA